VMISTHMLRRLYVHDSKMPPFPVQLHLTSAYQDKKGITYAPRVIVMERITRLMVRRECGVVLVKYLTKFEVPLKVNEDPEP